MVLLYNPCTPATCHLNDSCYSINHSAADGHTFDRITQTDVFFEITPDESCFDRFTMTAFVASGEIEGLLLANPIGWTNIVDFTNTAVTTVAGVNRGDFTFTEDQAPANGNNPVREFYYKVVVYISDDLSSTVANTTFIMETEFKIEKTSDCSLATFT